MGSYFHRCCKRKVLARQFWYDWLFICSLGVLSLLALWTIIRCLNPMQYLSPQIVVSHLPHQQASPNHIPSTMAGAEMTRSATEQPDVTMALAVTTRSATEQPDVTVPAGPAVTLGPTVNLGTLPPVTQMQWEIHVEFNNGMWWVMPHDLSDGILNQGLNGAQQVSFVWNWEETRRGSYRPDGAETSLNRYIIDFDIMQQRNIDNNRTRRVKVVCVLR